MSTRPNNFSFVIPRYLAGMAYPYYLEQELVFLKEQGIGAIVTLTGGALDRSVLEKYQMDYLHIPMPDFSPPTLEQIIQFVEFADKHIQEKRGVVVHCRAGMGRTGTMLACYLVKSGTRPQDSILQIRNLRPGSIETASQENAIIEYATHIEDRE